jgi:hypothetical protein
MSLSDHIEQEEYAIPVLPFIFPYSGDKATRREQIHSNLQKGILFEDTGLFLPWSTPYGAIEKIAEQKQERGDRIIWYLGHRTILGGYKCHATVSMWKTGPLSRPIQKIEETLGTDYDGNQKLLASRDSFNASLGELENSNFGMEDDLYIGNLNWKVGNCYVTLVGIEQFAYKYFLYVGLPD